MMIRDIGQIRKQLPFRPRNRFKRIALNLALCYHAHMKAKLTILLCSALLTGAVSADSVTNEIETTARCSLVDGSLLIGEPSLTTLPFGSAFGDISVPLASLDSLDVEKKQDRTDPSNVVDRISTILHLKNGDRLTTTPGFADFGLQTSFGTVTLGLPALRSVAFSHRKSSNNTDGLVFHCTFDSGEAIEHPAVGPSGHFDAGEIVAGRFGQALHVPARTVAARYQIPPIAGMSNGGCIEFWAKLDNGKEYFADGGDPGFFALDCEGGPIILLQYAANDGCGMSGLSLYSTATLASSPFCGTSTYRQVLGTSYREWHHYAIVWDENGVNGADNVYISVFVDGKPFKMNGRNNTPKAARKLSESLSTKTFDLHIPRYETKTIPSDSKSPFSIDEFKIWNYPKTDF